MRFTVKAYTGGSEIYVHPKTEEDLIKGLICAIEVDKELTRIDIYDHEEGKAFMLDKIPLPSEGQLKEHLVEIEYDPEVKRYPIFE